MRERIAGGCCKRALSQRAGALDIGSVRRHSRHHASSKLLRKPAADQDGLRVERQSLLK
jgi:hypothetical protein